MEVLLIQSYHSQGRNKELFKTTYSLFFIELMDSSLSGCEHPNLPITSAGSQDVGAIAGLPLAFTAKGADILKITQNPRVLRENQFVVSTEETLNTCEWDHPRVRAQGNSSTSILHRTIRIKGSSRLEKTSKTYHVHPLICVLCACLFNAKIYAQIDFPKTQKKIK